MSRCSLKNRPGDQTIDTIETFDIPFAFRTTLGENGADFVLQRASVQNPESFILVNKKVYKQSNKFLGIHVIYAKRNLFYACNINENERRRDNARQKKKV
jgi:hypothetical protein